MMRSFHNLRHSVEIGFQNITRPVWNRFILCGQVRSVNLVLVAIIQINGSEGVVFFPQRQELHGFGFAQKWQNPKNRISDFTQASYVEIVKHPASRHLAFDERNRDQELILGVSTALPDANVNANTSRNDAAKNRQEGVKSLFWNFAHVVLLIACFVFGLWLTFTGPVVKLITRAQNGLGSIWFVIRRPDLNFHTQAGPTPKYWCW